MRRCLVLLLCLAGLVGCGGTGNYWTTSHVHLMWDAGSHVEMARVGGYAADGSSWFQWVNRPASDVADVVVKVPTSSDAWIEVVGLKNGDASQTQTAAFSWQPGDRTIHFGGSAIEYHAVALGGSETSNGTGWLPFGSWPMYVWGKNASGEIVLFDFEGFTFTSSDEAQVPIVNQRFALLGEGKSATVSAIKDGVPVANVFITNGD